MQSPAELEKRLICCDCAREMLESKEIADALKRHAPIMGDERQQRMLALKIEVQRLHNELAAERLRFTIFKVRAGSALQELWADEQRTRRAA